MEYQAMATTMKEESYYKEIVSGLKYNWVP